MSGRDQAGERRVRAAAKYRPATIDLLLVAESPPENPERYFYFEDVKAHDSLFRYVSKHVLGVAPERAEKPTTLEQLKRRGVLLIDLRPDPDDRTPLRDHVRELVRRCRELSPKAIILIKKDVYSAAFEELRRAGLPVVDEPVPFPGSGQQRKFDEAFPRALAKAGWGSDSLVAELSSTPTPVVTPGPTEAPRPVILPAPIVGPSVAVAPPPMTARSIVGNNPSVASTPARSASVATSLPVDADAESHPIDRATIDAIVAGTHGAPFDVLGPRAADPNRVAIRAFLPGASSAAVELGGRHHPMVRLHEAGFFEATLADVGPSVPYRLWTMAPDGTTTTLDDPYRFGPLLTDYDLFLLGEGTHERLWEKLGAHLVTHQGVKGVHFAVWAPNATRVSVIGDFDGWDERRHPMRNLGVSGVWELFIPGLEAGEIYKYHLRTRWGGTATVKADPYGFAMERPPDTASKVWDLSRYRWKDHAWMSNRHERQGHDRPMTIYEVHPGSWRRGEGGRWLTWREMAERLVPYVRDLGYTHIELMPISEHPFDGSWGYQPVGYYAPTSRFGPPDDFRAFVDAAHQADIGVLLDWVPAHFPKDAHGLGFFDGTHLYEHADPRRGQHQDWGTFIFNFSRPEVTAFLLSNALFWLEQYHVDGLRVDAVASMLYLDYSRKEGEWVPNRYGGRENIEAIEFLRRFNVLVHGRFPDTLTIAEESTSWPMVSRPAHLGGLGFDMKWNMGWMHDMLAYMSNDPVFRRHHHEKLTFSLLYAFSENFVLPLSHDEVVHLKRSLIGKMPGDRWRKFANLRALYAYMYGHPGKKLLFMGGELAQPGEWNHDAELSWDALDQPEHLGVQRLVRDLNRLHREHPALHQVDFDSAGFEWIDFRDVDQSVVAFVRRARDPADLVVVVANLTPVPRPGYRIGAPAPGAWRELLNTDRADYGGGGYSDLDGVVAEPFPWQSHEQSLVLDLPPLSVVMLEPEERLTVAPASPP